MSDDTESFAGTMDTMGQWTIKVIAMRSKNKALAAAREEGLNVGQWLEKRIDEWASTGQAVAVSRSAPVPVSPAAPLALAAPVAPADSLEHLERIISLAGKVADLRERAGKGNKIVADASRMLRERLAAMPGAAPRRTAPQGHEGQERTGSFQ